MYVPSESTEYAPVVGGRRSGWPSSSSGDADRGRFMSICCFGGSWVCRSQREKGLRIRWFDACLFERANESWARHLTSDGLLLVSSSSRASINIRPMNKSVGTMKTIDMTRFNLPKSARAFCCTAAKTEGDDRQSESTMEAWERERTTSKKSTTAAAGPAAGGQCVGRAPYGLSIYRDLAAERFRHLFDADFEPNNSFAKQELEPMASRACDSVSLHSNASTTRTYERLDCKLQLRSVSSSRRLCVFLCSTHRKPGGRENASMGF